MRGQIECTCGHKNDLGADGLFHSNGVASWCGFTLNKRDKWVQWHRTRFTCGGKPLNEVHTQCRH